MSVVPGSQRLIRYWSVSAADDHYKLVQTREIRPIIEVMRPKGFLGLGGYETVPEHGKASQFTSTVATGNEAWAERTAKHYGLTIENEAEAS